MQNKMEIFNILMGLFNITGRTTNFAGMGGPMKGVRWMLMEINATPTMQPSQTLLVQIKFGKIL
jgi:hypothetical protein